MSPVDTNSIRSWPDSSGTVTNRSRKTPAPEHISSAYRMVLEHRFPFARGHDPTQVRDDRWHLSRILVPTHRDRGAPHPAGMAMVRGRESQAAWETLLKQIPAPLVVICDGGSGVRAALREQSPDTLTQRCIFHVWMNLRTHLSLRPRTPAEKSLLEIGKQLCRVTTIPEAVTWVQQLNDWQAVFEHLTRERSYAKRRLKDGSWDSPSGKRWWYTHDRLRKAYNVLAELRRREHLSPT